MPAPAPAPLLYPTCAECAGVGFKGIPEWLWDMEEDIGVAAFRAFLDRHGGREIELSARPVQGQSPEMDTAVAWLRQRFGTGRLSVPLGPSSLRARRFWTAFKLLEGGATAARVAEATGSTRRCVGRQKASLIKFGALKAPGAAAPAYPKHQSPRDPR